MQFCRKLCLTNEHIQFNQMPLPSQEPSSVAPGAPQSQIDFDKTFFRGEQNNSSTVFKRKNALEQYRQFGVVLQLRATWTFCEQMKLVISFSRELTERICFYLMSGGNAATLQH